MQPNTIPTGYAKKSPLVFPLKLQNNKNSKWTLLLFILAVLLSISTKMFAHTEALGFDYSRLAPYVLNALTSSEFLLLFWYFRFPSQDIMIESEKIIVRNHSGKIAMNCPLGAFDYVAVYSDRLFGYNSFINYEFGLWGMINKTKIVVHVKQSEEKVLFDCPSENVMAYARDLGLLLNLPVKL